MLAALCFAKGMPLAHENVLIAEYSANFGRPLAKQHGPCCLIKARRVWIQLQVTVDQWVPGKHSDSFTSKKKKVELLPEDEDDED